MNNNIEVLHSKIAELEAENALLKSDVAILGPENLKLSNALTLARVEIARLSAPKNGKGRPSKDITGAYEDYLVRETMQVVTESISTGKKLSERDACKIANERIRNSALEAQDAGIPGPFAGLSTNHKYVNDESIYTAFRRGKRLLGWGSKRQSKK